MYVQLTQKRFQCPYVPRRILWPRKEPSNIESVKVTAKNAAERRNHPFKIQGKGNILQLSATKTFSWKSGTQDSLCYMKQILKKLTKKISKNRKNPTQLFEEKVRK